MPSVIAAGRLSTADKVDDKFCDELKGLTALCFDCWEVHKDAWEVCHIVGKQ